MIKDLSIMYRALWDRMHEGATGISQCTSASCTDVSECPLSASDLTMHATSCLNPITTWIIWTWYLINRNLQSKFRSGRWWIVHFRKSMFDFVGHVLSNDFVTSLWFLCHKIYTKHWRKYVWIRILWKVSFFKNHPSTNVNEINNISNTNPAQFCKK